MKKEDKENENTLLKREFRGYAASLVISVHGDEIMEVIVDVLSEIPPEVMLIMILFIVLRR